MYRGLIAAKPAEFALNAIEQSKAPALPDPTASNLERQDRLVALSVRLDELEHSETEDKINKDFQESLTERLRRKRRGETEEAVQEEKNESVELETVASPAVSLLNRVEKLTQDTPSSPQPSTSTAGLAATLPKGLLARSEWIDLVLSCVSKPAPSYRF